jgi:hypothetical protein
MTASMAGLPLPSIAATLGTATTTDKDIEMKDTKAATSAPSTNNQNTNGAVGSSAGGGGKKKKKKGGKK